MSEPNIDSIVAIGSEKMAKGLGAAATKPSTAPRQVVEQEVVNTGPINFEAMKAKVETTKPIPVVANDDSKVGKAFKIARGTYKNLNIKSMDKFLSLFDEIYNNL